jgi:hypothetical protein
VIDTGVYVVLGEVDLELLTRVARQAVSDLEHSEAEPGAPTVDGLEKPVLVADVAGWSLIVSPMRGTSTVHLQLDHGEDAALAVEALPKIAAELSRRAMTVACAWLRPEEGPASIELWRGGDSKQSEPVSSSAGPTDWPLSGLIAGVGRTSAAEGAAISARTITVPLDAPLDPKQKDELAALRRDAGASPTSATADAERLAKSLTRDAAAPGATPAAAAAPAQNLTALYVLLGLLLATAIGLMIMFSIMASKQTP